MESDQNSMAPGDLFDAVATHHGLLINEDSGLYKHGKTLPHECHMYVLEALHRAQEESLKTGTATNYRAVARGCKVAPSTLKKIETKFQENGHLLGYSEQVACYWI